MKKDNKNDKIISYHKDFCVRGIRYDSVSADIPRQELIDSSYKNDSYSLKEFTWKNKPAFYVINDKNGHDIGVVPKELVDKFKQYYDDPRYETNLVFKDFLSFENDISTIKFNFQATRKATEKDAPINSDVVPLPTKDYSKIIMWCLLVFIPPVGLIYLWTARTDKETSEKKKKLSIIFGVWSVIFILLGIFGKSSDDNQQPVIESDTESISLSNQEQDNSDKTDITLNNVNITTDELYGIIKGVIAENDKIIDISNENGNLLIKVTLSDTTLPNGNILTADITAPTTASNITDAILDLDDNFLNTLNTITVDFGDIGKVTRKMSETQNEGYGKYFIINELD